MYMCTFRTKRFSKCRDTFIKVQFYLTETRKMQNNFLFSFCDFTLFTDYSNIMQQEEEEHFASGVKELLHILFNSLSPFRCVGIVAGLYMHILLNSTLNTIHTYMCSPWAIQQSAELGQGH